eukprot:3743345-Amphidinium_carterae.1
MLQGELEENWKDTATQSYYLAAQAAQRRGGPTAVQDCTLDIEPKSLKRPSVKNIPSLYLPFLPN